MGVALQCPDCGFKHRLDAVSDRDVFACAQCGRELKVPAAYRADAGATNGSGPAPARPAGSARSAPARPKHKIGAAPMRLPVRILLWVVAFVLGALVVRYVAKVTGFAGGDTFFDLLVDGSIGTYARLLALVPVWALFSTLFATLFIDGPRAWARRRAGETPSRPGSAVPRIPKTAPGGASGASGAAVASAAAAGAAAGTARSSRSIPRREPAPVSSRPARAPSPRLPDPPPVAPAVTRTTAVAAAGAAATSAPESDDGGPDFTAQAAAGQRPRRIPRRGDGS